MRLERNLPQGKANDKREPLKHVQSSSTATLPSSVAVESVAVCAVLALSGTNALANGAQATNDDDNFSLKHLEGKQVRMCNGCGEAIRAPPAVPAPQHDLCVVKKEFISCSSGDGSLKEPYARQNCHYHVRQAHMHRRRASQFPAIV